MLGTYCLGGTLTSRLDRVLREEKGYTYGVRAFGQVLRSGPDGGAAMLAISGSVDTPNTGPRSTTCGRCCARWPPRV